MLQTAGDLNFFGFLLDGYRVSEQASKTTDANVLYFGFVNRMGEWYIMEQDTSAGSNDLQTYRFVKGDSGYTTAWTAREAQTYDYFYTTFK